MNLNNINPEIAFSPERRELEYKFLKEENKIISELDIDKDDKIFMKKKLQDYYEEFDEQYTKYHRMMREYNMWVALTALNIRMKNKSN
jgi:hypothetical protein